MTLNISRIGNDVKNLRLVLTSRLCLDKPWGRISCHPSQLVTQASLYEDLTSKVNCMCIQIICTSYNYGSETTLNIECMMQTHPPPSVPRFPATTLNIHALRTRRWISDDWWFQTTRPRVSSVVIVYIPCRHTHLDWSSLDKSGMRLQMTNRDGPPVDPVYLTRFSA